MLGALCFMFCSCHDQVGKKASSGEDTHNYVDLGLPSGTLWATCNIGASSPEEYGDYFAWGETKGYNSGKNIFTFASYKWCKGYKNALTKYCSNGAYGYKRFTDNKTELELKDDAAYVNWGPDWRMPSIEQIEELIDSAYTNKEWVLLNGVEGYKITSKKNGNSIFLPASGFHYNDALYKEGSGGYIWSRTLFSSCPYLVRNLGFVSGNLRTYFYRYYGLSVRPVRSSE